MVHAWYCNVLQVQEQTRRIATMGNELSLLEASLQDSQRQGMALNARLTLCEAKNDELLSHSQVKGTSTSFTRSFTLFAMASQVGVQPAGDVPHPMTTVWGAGADFPLGVCWTLLLGLPTYSTLHVVILLPHGIPRHSLFTNCLTASSADYLARLVV
jgi:hypothetical protein